jgi:hypothetical protein
LIAFTAFLRINKKLKADVATEILWDLTTWFHSLAK